MKRFLFLVLMGVCLAPAPSLAQVYGSNTVEFQVGNLPYEGSREYSTSYDQLNLHYDADQVSLFGKFEQFYTPNHDRNYFDLTQKRIQFQDNHFRVRVGNFYETLGRGLLLRSYDIPGSVYEDAYLRTRYAFFRDLEGLGVDYIDDRFEIKAIRAHTLYNPLPPNFEPDSLRRPDLVEAVQANFYATPQLNVGAIFMRSNSTSGKYRQFASLLSEYNLSENIQLFGEYAFETNSTFRFSEEEDSYAIYAGLNFYSGSWGGSVEVKDYQNMLLGSGFNDPPSLIKEHTYPLLNRSTHVLETSGEIGVQLESYYNFEAGHGLTANVTHAVNDGFIKFEYTELFLEGLYEFSPQFSLKSFFDYANDDLKGEKNRLSVGVIANQTLPNKWNTILDLQYQQFERAFEPGNSENVYTSIALSIFPTVTAALIFEASTDPQLTDNPTTFTTIETKTRTWLGGNFSWKVNSANTLEVFGGKRRGGPACTSGICYEILDFEGLEARFSTRF